MYPRSIEIWVVELTTLQKELPKVSFLGIFRASTPQNDFLVATLLLFVKKLLEVKEKIVEKEKKISIVGVDTLRCEHAQQLHI